MKKAISIILSVILVCCSLCVFATANESKTVFYLDYGNATFGTGNVSGYDKDGNLVTGENKNGYTVTQKDSSKSVTSIVSVESGNFSFEILNVNIKSDYDFDFAICVLNSAQANITIKGENHVTSGKYRAGVDIASTAKAVLDGDGILYATSYMEAGIGGGNAKSNGNLTINSGTIIATGGIGGYSAGIGGGTSGNGGTITINGGNVTAIGGDNAAGIGGGNISNGGTITLNGGTITAKGGAGGAGIGGGYMGNGGKVVINGASVKATAGANVTSAIGNGEKCKTSFSGVTNSAGKAVKLTKFAYDGKSEVFFNGDYNYSISSPHSGDSNLYLYLPDTSSVLTVKPDENTYEFYTGNSSGLTKKNAVNGIAQRYKDLAIYDESFPTAQNDFSLVNNGGKHDLKFNSIVADSFYIVGRGDVNRDGKVNSSDALNVLMYITEIKQPNEYEKILSDFNSDGKTTSYDALLVLYKAVQA